MVGEDGYPNGIFTANACNIAKALIPDFSMEERRKILLETMKYGVAHGLTSVQSNDVGTTFMDGPAAFKLFHDVYDSGEALLRYRHQVCFNDFAAFETYLTEGEFACGKYGEDSWLTLGPLKLFKDGSLGARTALMRDGYALTERITAWNGSKTMRWRNTASLPSSTACRWSPMSSVTQPSRRP